MPGFFLLEINVDNILKYVQYTHKLISEENMKEKQKKTSRLHIVIKPESREMLESLGVQLDRSLTSVIENLIKVEYHRNEETKR